jgi:CO dehydrogenase nickel-insertion accessory protein CooC1
LKQLAQEIDLKVFGYIPQDDKIAYYDLIGRPIIELPTSPGLEAVRNMVEKCIFKERFGERISN